MSFAYSSIKGLTFYDTRRVFNGFTLVTPVEGVKVWLIDMYGKVVHSWDTGYNPVAPAELLPNGHLLYAGKVEGGPLPGFEGAGGVLLELDWHGNKLNCRV